MKLHLQPTSEPLVSVTFFQAAALQGPSPMPWWSTSRRGSEMDTRLKRTCWTYFEYPHFFCGLDIEFRLTYSCYAATICHLILCFWRSTDSFYVTLHASYKSKAVCGSVSQRQTVIMTSQYIPYLLSQDGLIQKLRISFRGLSRLRFDRGSMSMDVN